MQDVIDNSDAIEGKVLSVEQLLPTIFKVKLILDGKVNYKAGQYLNVVMDESDKRPFSIASVMAESVGADTIIELHIGGLELNNYSEQVINKALETGMLDVEIPRGNSWLQLDSIRPILLLAGGTGYSYIRPLLLEALANPRYVDGSIRPIYFYWGVNDEPFLYDSLAVSQLVNNFPELDFRPVLYEPSVQWNGRKGMLLDAVENDFTDLSSYDIYLAGRMEFAKLARERLTALKSANIARIFSDIYAYI
ncbi:NAD(P)H-flavin reductase [Thorsellia anophelis]|uniref:Aquacobalamin reductase / NAD(P)H-flavin reductase n=1 Tax=Thorsellia anophelis DSM 18579 TaxID=1123402 RepID=A0A1I0F0E1_9GAMM|nr:NAD(P)H-flavin reductase [Thorsellia anophelis]SET51399.1 aquacobalamin reductase / NAD(P)H-flavin reductase [Thorsellia anophelis DSM 18579]